MCFPLASWAENSHESLRLLKKNCPLLKDCREGAPPCHNKLALGRDILMRVSMPPSFFKLMIIQGSIFRHIKIMKIYVQECIVEIKLFGPWCYMEYFHLSLPPTMTFMNNFPLPEEQLGNIERAQNTGWFNIVSPVSFHLNLPAHPHHLQGSFHYTPPGDAAHHRGPWGSMGPCTAWLCSAASVFC